MSTAVLVALITGACAIVGQIIIAGRTTHDLYSRLDKQSELADTRIMAEISVIKTEITELRKQVEKHNQVIERTFALEKEQTRQAEQIKTLFNRE